VSATAFTPARGTAPRVGTKPTTPQNDAGRITEPAVCVPSANGAMCAATAAADPLDEPPGVWSRPRGLRVAPGVKFASSAVTVLPNTQPPALRSAATQAASAAGTWPM